MRIVADLHIHSRYSRACSREMEVEALSRWAKLKGVDVLGTGDFTHPLYFSELKAKLEPADGGLLGLKRDLAGIRFIPTVEVTNIYHQNGKLHKIHTLIVAPTLEAVEKINRSLARRGNLQADGRPTFTFPVKELVKIALDVSADCLLVPAHAWTPWFSVFGSKSGFDSLEDCFQEETENIRAIETGLSSDPAMNRRLSALDGIALLSNSDAHSPKKIAREANVLQCELTYREIIAALTSRDPNRFLFTIEFFPEEGKYHYDGHRQCGVVLNPAESRRLEALCPECGRPLTIGVLHRIDDLADRQGDSGRPSFIPTRHLVPLEEILAEASGVKSIGKAVAREYQRMTALLGSELEILLDVSEEELHRSASPRVCQAILNARHGRVRVAPGYDGLYGKISLFSPEEKALPEGRLVPGLS